MSMGNACEPRGFGFRHRQHRHQHGCHRHNMIDSGSLPLSMISPGTEITVSAIHGRDNTRRFLENLGFVEGAKVTVVSELGGNVIVNVKDSRVAISMSMAARIYTN
jgi:ferrous iron transport protein A